MTVNRGNRGLYGIGLIVFMILSGVAAAAERGYFLDRCDKIEPTRKVVYKTVNGQSLLLHVFEPEGFKLSDKRPCAIVFHGGGWVSGEPRRAYLFAEHFAKLGMVGISVQYRLSNAAKKTTPFECVKDARSAVRYVRNHATDFGIDPDRLIVAGGSAGGHLAVSNLLFNEVNEAGEDTTISTMPQAAILFYPVIDTSPAGFGNDLLKEQWQKLSPVLHVREKLPPTILFHGTADTTTPYLGAKQFHEAMQKAGNHCELITNEGGEHSYFIYEQAPYEQVISRVDKFLAEHAPETLTGSKK